MSVISWLCLALVLLSIMGGLSSLRALFLNLELGKLLKEKRKLDGQMFDLTQVLITEAQWAQARAKEDF